MYKILLSWRYLRTRFIALASIISVTLGVATLIVVNSVMSGFVSEMRHRLHDILSDIEFDAGLGELSWPEHHQACIHEILGDEIEASTTIVRVPALMTFDFRGRTITQQILLIGIDESTYGRVCEIQPYLSNQHKQQLLNFFLEVDGYDDKIGDCGWGYRREKELYRLEHLSSWGIEAQTRQREQEYAEIATRLANQPLESLTPPTNRQLTVDIPSFELPVRPPNLEELAASGDHLPGASFDSATLQPFDSRSQWRPQPSADELFSPLRDQHTGIILGKAIANRKVVDAESDEVRELFLLRPGDDVRVTLPTAGENPSPIAENCTVVDFYQSNMHEYDSTFAFMSLRRLQQLRGMIDPVTGEGSVSAIQIRMKPGADLDRARDRLIAELQPEYWGFVIQTWQDLQRPLLSAVNMELTILNILLFLIIAVAGFGILATFFMIVVEKTKDIGILKSLGASSRGVMSIFLGYGLALGAVGTGVGIAIGLVFVARINQIAEGIGWLTGRQVFDPTIYYFSKIPTVVDVQMVLLVGLGAVGIAVAASVLPALRAARMHPVEALRYE
ncbi:MAG TPA: FtsX-like permease family protein [Pirellulaceae bacterium]|nr:FtsX-like permease family protein [Pirellulaceae bacterium]